MSGFHGGLVLTVNPISRWWHCEDVCCTTKISDILTIYIFI